MIAFLLEDVAPIAVRRPPEDVFYAATALAQFRKGGAEVVALAQSAISVHAMQLVQAEVRSVGQPGKAVFEKRFVASRGSHWPALGQKPGPILALRLSATITRKLLSESGTTSKIVLSRGEDRLPQ